MGDTRAWAYHGPREAMSTAVVIAVWGGPTLVGTAVFLLSEVRVVWPDILRR